MNIIYKRCTMELGPSTPSQETLFNAIHFPYLHFDDQEIS